MFKIFLRWASLSLFLFTAHQASLAKDSLPVETLTEMQALQAQFNLPSLSVAIAQNDKVVFAKAIGYADVKTKRLATEKTQYSVGSIAKPMTGLALLKLVDDKKLSLDAPVSDYVKQPVYTDQFSVRELAAHIAGVRHDTPERDVAEFNEPKDHSSPFEAFYVFEKHPLKFEPGSEFGYSSNGYILLSAVIEAVSEKNYVEYLGSTLWPQYTMRRTEQDTSFAGKNEEATYYSSYQDENDYTAASLKRDRSFLFGGGGFISTPTDLVNMARAVYDDAYLTAETKQALFSPVKLRNGEINSDRYSIGWRVGKLKLEDDSPEWTALHHGGVTDQASNAYLLVVPECRVSIAFATNTVPDKFWRMRKNMANILKRYIDKDKCN